MNTQTCNRLLWQVPVLILLSASLIPDLSWYSSTIGLWPIWLLSMPITAFMRRVYLARNQSSLNHAINQTQVLVFQKKPSHIIVRERRHSKAA